MASRRPSRGAPRAQLAAAVDHMHLHGVLHRDLSSENVFFGSGERRHVLVGDLGLSKKLEHRSQSKLSHDTSFSDAMAAMRRACRTDDADGDLDLGFAADGLAASGLDSELLRSLLGGLAGAQAPKQAKAARSRSSTAGA